MEEVLVLDVGRDVVDVGDGILHRTFLCTNYDLKFNFMLNSRDPNTDHSNNGTKQARVAQLVAHRLAVPEIRVQTPPGAN